MIARGLDADTPRLWVIDGSKALRRAIMELFGASALVHRGQEHKRRNVLDHLPRHLHASVGRAMNDAWHSKDAALARPQLERLANSLAKGHPGAAASLREGLAETLTPAEPPLSQRSTANGTSPEQWLRAEVGSLRPIPKISRQERGPCEPSDAGGFLLPTP